MGIIDVVRLNNPEKWTHYLKRSRNYDFYHSIEYHKLAHTQGEGEPILFVYSENDCFIGLPLLIRPIIGDQYYFESRFNYYDATSVYGYTGPIMSQVDLSTSLLNGFADAFQRTLSQLKIVSVFSRLHPLIEYDNSLDQFFEKKIIGQTVSIDLTQSNEEQILHYRSGHRQEINKLKRGNFICLEDANKRYLDDFIKIYYETMDSVHANQLYYFPKAYFKSLFSLLGDNMRLFVCTLNGEITCGGIFSLCAGIVQYHLSGTNIKYKKNAPIKLLLDYVRTWAKDNNAHTFHLGGGVGSKQDTLYQFKTGFSNRRHDFSVWRKIIMPDIYHLLSEKNIEYHHHNNNLNTIDTNYFPLYRSPLSITSSN